MTDDGIDVTPEDALQVAQRALARVGELEDELAALKTGHEELAEDHTALKLRVSEQDEDRPYKSLSTDEKVGKVREHAFRKAQDGHGKARLDYDDVMWEVFDGKPGPNHCYKLLRLAAGLTDVPDGESRPTGGEIPGFKCRDPSGDENYHLAVNADRVKREMALYPGNKTVAEGGRSG